MVTQYLDCEWHCQFQFWIVQSMQVIIYAISIKEQNSQNHRPYKLRVSLVLEISIIMTPYIVLMFIEFW